MWRKGRHALRAMTKTACALALSASFAGCSLLPKEEAALKPPLVKPAKENFELYEVKKGAIVKQVTGVGTLASDKMEYLFFTESGGRLSSMNVSLGSEVKQGDVIAQLETGDLENKIRQQQIEVEKAEIMLEKAKEGMLGDAREIRLKALDVEKEKLELEHLRGQLEKTKLVSGVNGIVTYIEPIKEGDSVQAYKQLVTVSDPKQMKLTYEFTNLADLTGIQIGMEAEVRYKNATYAGKVVQIPATAPQSDVKAIQDKNAKSIVIDVAGLPADAAIGESADITIVTEKREDVLIIPRVGLRSYMGRDYVQVMEGESRKEIDVEKGVVSATEVEIRKGLKEGQRVILNN